MSAAHPCYERPSPDPTPPPDEPTAGLDPRSRHSMWAVIRELVDDGVTIFLTTQYLEEALVLLLQQPVAAPELTQLRGLIGGECASVTPGPRLRTAKRFQM